MASTSNDDSDEEETMDSSPIAIIGMSCRFAGDAVNPEAFWELLASGKDAWSEVPTTRFDPTGTYHPNGERSNTVCIKPAPPSISVTKR